VRLSPQRRAELRTFLRGRYENLKEYKSKYSNDALCRRFHVTPRTLSREAIAMLDEECLPSGHTAATRHAKVAT
jgi:hypothetical protein